jgi:glycosyltransferase involved in cell wall biosynthesis
MARPLKILIDARMVTQNVHGIARYTANLARGVAAAGNRVSILSVAQDTPNLIGAEYLYEVISCRTPFASPLEAIELSMKSHGDFDIVHFPSFAVPLKLPPRTVITIHDLIHLRPPAHLLHQIYYKTVVRRALRKCEGVITVSQWSKKDLLQLTGLKSEKIHVVRNGLEDLWFHPEDIGESGEKSPYIICASNPKPHKNVRTLLRACEILWDQDKDFKLILSLGGAELPAGWLTNRFHNRVRVIRDLGESEFMALIKGAAALVSPSLFEGFDLPAAEALALGTPIVISTGSAHAEFRGSRLNFYEPAESAASLASTLAPVLFSAREPAGNLTHNVPTLKHMIQETLAVYDEVLERRRD